MLEALRKLFRPPVFPSDEDKTRKARYANAIMIAFLAVVILFETAIRVSENYTGLSFIDLMMHGLRVFVLLPADACFQVPGRPVRQSFSP